MLKQALLEKLENSNNKHVSLLDVFSMFEEESYIVFCDKLKVKIEYFFNLPDITDKSRIEDLVAARSAFYYIAKKHGIKESVSSAYLKFGRSSAYNLIEKFPSYCKYYPLQKTKIQLILNWYFEEYVAED